MKEFQSLASDLSAVGVEASKVSKIASHFECVRQAATRERDVAEESKRVQQVGLATGIRTNDEQAGL